MTEANLIETNSMGSREIILLMNSLWDDFEAILNNCFEAHQYKLHHIQYPKYLNTTNVSTCIQNRDSSALAVETRDAGKT